jgi:CheY-like chemotaxis protein
MRNVPRTIALIDDDADSRLLARAVLGLEYHIAEFDSGEQALHGLGLLQPDLILLDLNLPRMDGREVLQAIKSDPELASIPVVVLTTSEAEEDVLRSYSLHANAYVTKPVDFERFIQVVRQIDEFFVTVVRLPNR